MKRMLKDIDHIQIAIPNDEEDTARTFYGGLLGMEEIDKPENLKTRGGVWFRIGDRQVHMGVQEDFRPATKAHPAFLVDDLQHVQRVLERHGYPIINDEPLPGFQRFYSRDPFGNRLEFLQQI
jgi:catechol 2,3-dioxygenase-like lactoylglutathione lyase family enzyme